MPAKSVAQRQAIAIAEHDPDKLYSRNKGLLSMSKSDMHDFASTKQTGLPKYAGSKGRTVASSKGVRKRPSMKLSGGKSV